MQNHRIMIVDDDPHICEIVQVYCDREGFNSTYSHSGTEAMELLTTFKPDLIVLDVLLANENGIDWCRNARNLTSAPIMFLSSQEEDEVKISALSYGGDDYVTKPFSPGVLMAKIKAHLRRVSTGRREQLLELPGLTLDFYTQSVNMGVNLSFYPKRVQSVVLYGAKRGSCRQCRHIVSTHLGDGKSGRYEDSCCTYQ